MALRNRDHWLGCELEEDVGEVIDQINNAKAIRKILTNLIENSDDTP